MATNRAAKKATKKLVKDYWEIVEPLNPPKRVIITKGLVPIHQPFEIFTFYKPIIGTHISNTTTYLIDTNLTLTHA